MALAFLESMMNLDNDSEPQRKRLIQILVKKVVVYSDKLDIYLINRIDTNNSDAIDKKEVTLNNNSNYKLYVDNGCLILECRLE